jgi:galactoside O-acetyltransferase
MNTPLPPPVFQLGKTLPEAALQEWLGGCGQGVKIFEGCRLFPPKRISVGHRSQIDEQVFIFAGEGVIIGSYVHLAFASSISGGGNCIIHDFAGISPGVRLVTGSENIHGEGLTNPTVPPPFRSVNRGKIEIGAHALIFTNSIVLPNVTIGEGAVAGAGSIIHHDLAPWGIYAGNPLVRVGNRSRDRVLELAKSLREKTRAHPSF